VSKPTLMTRNVRAEQPVGVSNVLSDREIKSSLTSVFKGSVTHVTASGTQFPSRFNSR
jgi:hypothetical protein